MFLVNFSKNIFTYFIGIYKREFEKEEPLVVQVSDSKSKPPENKFAKIVKARLECTALKDIVKRIKVKLGSFDGGCILFLLNQERIEQLGLRVININLDFKIT